MERRGSGLTRIIEETRKLIRYSSGQHGGQGDRINEIIDFYSNSRSRIEIQKVNSI